MSEHTHDVGVIEYATTSDTPDGGNRPIYTRVLWKETDVQMSVAERDLERGLNTNEFRGKRRQYKRDQA